MGDAAGATIRAELNRIGQLLLLSRQPTDGDPVTQSYVVQRGDILTKIGRQHQVPWQFIMRINGIRRDRDLKAGQLIKVPHGPFGAVITKSTYQMDVYLTDRHGQRHYVWSCPVGLGADDSTPAGRWVVGSGKKKNPDWKNPRTGAYFKASDPKNPIGEYWIPLRGIDQVTGPLTGFGIHGTIEPQSIGQQRSMGCVRLRPDDVVLAFDMLAEQRSEVTIRP